MTLAEFDEFLESMGVDVSKFGRGQAKKVEGLFQDVTSHKCYLTLHGAKLERRVELVRISLCAKGSDGVDRTLKVGMEIMSDGRARTRNQKLAVTIVQGQTWKEAVVEMFVSRFGVPSERFDAHFLLEGTWPKEETLYSPSIPGIRTVYLTTEVRMRVRQIASPELKNLGLPAMGSFSTSHGGKTSHWSWKAPDEALSTADNLTQLLQDHHISVADIGDAAFQALIDEHDGKICTLNVSNQGEAPELLRHLQIVKIWITAEILSVPHVLVMRSKTQFDRTTKHSDRPISMRMSFSQTWQQAVTLAVTKRLGLDYQTQKECLVLDPHSYKLTEEVEYSNSYPGLKSVYRIHQVAMQAKDIQHLGALGLPEGTDFVITRQESNEDRIVLKYGWQPSDDCQSFVQDLPAFTRRMTHKKSDKEYRRNLVDNPVKAQGAKEAPEEPVLKRRVQAPEPITVPARSSWKSSYAVAEMMRGKHTDWARAKNAAKRIRDPEYHVGMFFEDCRAAFPELQLYQVDSATSSGRSGDDEYQRTVGALLAVFWLMRLHIDGKEGFCFGLDASWKPKCSQWQHSDESDFKKRQDFYQLADWDALQRLVIGAGLLEGPQGPHDKERTLALLVLMSVHDIMKLDVILPVVARHAGTWNGYKAGETVLDHDAALSYVLEHCPQALPSFTGLSPRQQESIRFTQTKLDYNMGWLVQGEAPPGALFRSFRKVVIAGNASERDIAFYFVHWFADLAGAEPYPLNGCEKFVVKFPRKVLGCFIDSFSVVWTLGPSKTETQVYEDYVVWRWATNELDLGPAPSGQGAIAKMRLILMAQGDSGELLRTLAALPGEDRQVLEAELAVTGCEGQGFQHEEDSPAGSGPAILVYYGPALLQKAGKRDLRGALVALAEVFRQARELWPFSALPEDVNRTVTVRIDALKDLQVSEFLYPESGFGYVLMRSSGQDGLVKLLPVVTYKSLDWSVHRSLELHEQKSRPRRTGLLRFGASGQTSERLLSLRRSS